MKSRMVKRILATLLAVVFLAGDVLPTVASDVEGSTQVIKEAEEEASSLWEDVTPAEDENKENEAETPAATETPATTEPTETEEKTEASTEETELTEIGEGETPLADGLDEEAEEEEEELDEEALDEEALEEEEAEEEEEERVTLAPVTVDDVTITVSGSKDAFVEGTYVSAVEVDPIKVEELVEGAAEETETIVKTYKAFDITLKIKNEDGEEEDVQPLNRESVKVSFEGDMLIPDEAAGETVTVYHVDDNLTTIKEEMSSEVVTVTDEDTQATTDVVEMETTHFSVFVISVNGYPNSSTAKWKVVDSADNSVGLKGAKFTLTRYKYGRRYDYDLWEYVYGYYEDSTQELTSDKDGYISFSVSYDTNYSNYSSHNYIYVLEETKAPKNHILPDNAWYLYPNKDNGRKIYVYDEEDGSDSDVDHFIGVGNNLSECKITNDPVDWAATYSIESANKTAKLLSWADRLYEIDLSTYVRANVTPEPNPKKVVIIADASGSMIYSDAKIKLADMKPGKIYFTDFMNDTNSNNGFYNTAFTPTINDVKSGLILDGGKCYNYARTGKYVFNVDGTWYQNDVSVLLNNKDYTLNPNGQGAEVFTGTEAYTNRSEMFILAATRFVDLLPDGTKLQITKFNNSDSEVLGQTTVSNTTRDTIKSKISTCVGEHNTATKPATAFSKAKTVFNNMGGQDEDCYVVFFADGELSQGATSPKSNANDLKNKDVTIYGVGLGSQTGSVIRDVATDDEHVIQSDNMDGIISAFNEIGLDIAKNVNATFTDTLSKDFIITDANGEPITNGVYDGASISTDSAGRQVITWSNISISCNTAFSKKFYVKAKTEFVGGNLVNTNDGNSFVVSLPESVQLSENGVRTKSASSAQVNVKGKPDAHDQEDTIKHGETLEKYIEKHIVKDWNSEEQETEEGEAPKDPRFTTSKDSKYADVVIKYYRDEAHQVEISLEDMKKEAPEEDTTYYVVVEVRPTTTGISAKPTVGSAMTQDGAYYCMDRVLDDDKLEAIAEAEYKIIVKGYDLLVETTKTADWKDGEIKSWADRTYKVELGAETFNKVTQEGEPITTIKTPVKVVFLLDASSSMRNDGKPESDWPLTKLQNQTKSFIEGLPLESEVAVVSFQKSASINVPITKIDSEEKRSEILSSISLPKKGSGTRSNEGLKIIESQILPQKDKKYEKTYIVFFTDGDTYVGDSDYANYPGKTRDERDAEHDRQAIENARKLKNRGVEIFSVGMGNIHADFLNSIATDSSHVYSGDGASSIAKNFTHIYDTISTPGKEETEPVAVDNIKFYDEVSKYFVLIDENGNPLRTGDTFDGGVVGEKNGLQTITWTGLSSTEKSDGNFGVSKTIYLKAKDEFAGGNGVPTNADFIVTVEDPDSEDEPEEYRHETPYVDVNCVATSGEKEDTIFLGEAVSSVLGVEGKLEEVENAMANDSYADDMFVFVTKSDVEWFTDETCEHPITLDDLLALKPTKETPFYGKVTYTPSSSANSPANKLQEFSVIGKYTIKIVDGKITVTKFIGNLGDASKLSYDGQPIFTFELLDESGKVVQTKALTFNDYSSTQKSVTFSHLGAGKYTVRELEAKGWQQIDAQGYQNIVINKDNPQNTSCYFTNKAVSQKNFADKDLVVNTVKKNEDGSISLNKVRTSDSNERHGE